MKKFWLILFAVLITGCRATSEIIKPEEYDATKHARLRVFSSSNSSINLVVGIDCESNNAQFLKPDGWFNKVNRIGMTQTEATDKAQMNGDTFREYVIPAGKVVNIKPSQTEFKTNCGIPGKPCSTTMTELCKYGPISENNLFGKILSATEKILKKVETLGLIPDEYNRERDDRRSFIPKAGHQYEFTPIGCSIIGNDITEEEITEVKLSPHYQCPPEKQ